MFGNASLVNNLCEQEVELTFSFLEEFEDKVVIQFTTVQGIPFIVEIDVNIEAGTILNNLPFDAEMTFHADAGFNDDPQSEFPLGAQVYAKLLLSPLVSLVNLPLSSITVDSFTLTQKGDSGEFETTNVMNEEWSGFSYTATPGQNQIATKFVLESNHFYVTKEDELCEADIGISITYQDNVRRKLSLRRQLTSQHIVVGFTITESISEMTILAMLKREASWKFFILCALAACLSYLISRACTKTTTKQDEYASLLAEYEEF